MLSIYFCISALYVTYQALYTIRKEDESKAYLILMSVVIVVSTPIIIIIDFFKKKKNAKLSISNKSNDVSTISRINQKGKKRN